MTLHPIPLNFLIYEKILLSFLSVYCGSPNYSSNCCFQASNLLKRLLASLTHQSIPIEGKYELHKFFVTLVNVQESLTLRLILSSNSAGAFFRFCKNQPMGWQGAPPPPPPPPQSKKMYTIRILLKRFLEFSLLAQANSKEVYVAEYLFHQAAKT